MDPFGCDRLIEARRARYTYGLKVACPFEQDQDPADERFVDDRGRVMCLGRFGVLVTTGDTIGVGQCVTEKNLSPVNPNQARLVVEFIAQ